MNWQKSVAELKRRHVFRVMGAYTVSFWVVLQVGDIVLPALGAPDWIMTLLIGIGIVGAPIAALLSWFYEVTHEGIRLDDGTPTPASGHSALSSRWIDYAIIASLVVILTFVLIRQPPTAPQIGTSIAVLPFRDVAAADGNGDYFGEGIAESIMDQLSGISGIQVAARTSSFSVDETMDARATAERLGVETLLEGTVQRAGSELRISARLIDGDSGIQVWNETFGGTLEGIFDLQDRISRSIARAMQVKLNLPGSSSLGTAQPEAYDQYLRGRDELRQQPSEPSINRAVAHFRNALRIDPDFGLASAGLCRARWELYELSLDPALANQAMELCTETQTRYPDLTETRIAIGSLHLGRGQITDAEQSFLKALERDPNHAEAHAGLAAAWMEQGRPGEAKEQLQIAIDLDPADWRFPSQRAAMDYRLGDLEAAEQAAHRALRLEPRSAEPWNLLGAIHFAQGEYRLAGDAFEQSINRSPNAWGYSNAGTNYFFASEFTRAEAMFRRALEMAPGDPRFAGFVAWSIRAQPEREKEAEPFHRDVIRTATERLEINVNDHEARAVLALNLAALGYADAARGAIASLVDPDELEMNVLVTAGLAHFLIGQHEEAAHAFDQAVGKGMPFELLRADPRLTAAWQLAPFAALTNQYQPETSLTQGAMQ